MSYSLQESRRTSPTCDAYPFGQRSGRQPDQMRRQPFPNSPREAYLWLLVSANLRGSAAILTALWMAIPRILDVG